MTLSGLSLKSLSVDFLDFFRSCEKHIHVFADSQCKQRRRIGSDRFTAVKSAEASASDLGRTNG
jgi:hypothetical protein